MIMRKQLIALLSCGIMLVSGCAADTAVLTSATTSSVTTGIISATTTTAGTTTTTASETTTTAVTTKAPETTVTTTEKILTPEDSGLEITYKDGWVYVYIPPYYTNENIGEYFRRTEWVVYVPDEHSMFRVVDGALYSTDMTILYAVPSWCEDAETKGLPSPKKAFTVPESVTWIAPNAFHMITSERPLINLYLHDGITEENRKELVLWGGTFVFRK